MKAQSGKLRISERVEACLHTKRAEVGSSTRSVVKAENLLTVFKFNLQAFIFGNAGHHIKQFPCKIPLRPSDTSPKTGEELAVGLMTEGRKF